MHEVVWGGYQLQTWPNDIMVTPQVNLNSQIWGQLGQWTNKGAHIWPCDSIPMAQTLCICPIWMYYIVVWGGYQPQPWWYGIISLHKWTWLRCNGIRVPPYMPLSSIFIRVVCRFIIFSQYWSVFSWYLPIPYWRKTQSVHFSIKILAETFFSPQNQKGGIGILLEDSAPPMRMRIKGVPTKTKELPAKNKFWPKYQPASTSNLPIPARLLVPPCIQL